MALPSQTDPLLDRLTGEQLIAAGADRKLLYIEAAPGSGKTTVAAQRFGCQRFAPPGARGADARPVLAVSFTRSATAELRRRVIADWGTVALERPNRIVTLDTIVADLLTTLLQSGRLAWPGGHSRLDVHDTWKVHVEHDRLAEDSFLELQEDMVQVVTRRRRKKEFRPKPEQLVAAVQAGMATHEAVRGVVQQALQQAEHREFIRERLRTTARALIVDEIFDANHLDLDIVQLAAESGLAVTIIGDPWQALYGFRGAQPQLVPGLVDTVGFHCLRLNRSFRWRTAQQTDLATRLRDGQGLKLQLGDVSQIDVALASTWKSLWDLGPGVLPLAFGSASGRTDEAAATLLLNCLAQSVLSQRATFLSDALKTLGITDSAATRRLEPALRQVLQALRTPETDVADTYKMLTVAVKAETTRDFPPVHPRRTSRLKDLQARLRSTSATMIPGYTIHQAKGREWDRVGVSLTDSEVNNLSAGLEQQHEPHRQLYVALTRARMATVEVRP